MMMNNHASDSMENVQYFSPEYNPQSIMNYYSSGIHTGTCSDPHVKNLIDKAKNHLSAIGWTFFYVSKKTTGTRELTYKAPSGRDYVTLRSACESALKNQDSSKKLPNLDASKINAGFKRKFESFVSDTDSSVVESQVIKSERLSCNKPMNKIQDVPRLMVTGNKQVAPKDKVNSSTKKQGGVLGSLIQNNVVERGSRVSYLSRKDGRVMATGRVYEDGIKCDCCDDMFLLTKFEAHAGSTNHRPAANIFFDDNRSILDCQTQLQLESFLPADDKSSVVTDVKSSVVTVVKSTNSVVTDVKSSDAKSSVVTDVKSDEFKSQDVKSSVVTDVESSDVKSTNSSDCVTGPNDEYCSFCNDGGELLLCGSCTSSFHSTCIGLDCLPDSDLWFCPACACQFCHKGQPSNLTEEGDSNVYDLLKCAQCEHHFHINCISNKLGFGVCADDAKWFCTENCERIYLGLMEIRGKVIPLKAGIASWSLLKYDQNDLDTYESTKSYSKLMKALDVMHECLVPEKHPLSDRKMIEDVIFSRATKRTNFEGFYTAVLEKNDEIITVVTLRIHGYKVAEIPFAATTFRYRRLGMCRILMNEVERMLRRLRVERIVLPASPEKVSTWTRSFGFSEMKDIERRDLVKCKFLEYLGAKKSMKKLKKMWSYL